MMATDLVNRLRSEHSHGLSDDATNEIELLRGILPDAAPPGIEDWCDECGGKDEKCPETCWIRRARVALKDVA
jgi:hypothetical protein